MPPVWVLNPYFFNPPHPHLSPQCFLISKIRPVPWLNQPCSFLNQCLVIPFLIASCSCQALKLSSQGSNAYSMCLEPFHSLGFQPPQCITAVVSLVPIRGGWLHGTASCTETVQDKGSWQLCLQIGMVSGTAVHQLQSFLPAQFLTPCTTCGGFGQHSSTGKQSLFSTLCRLPVLCNEND